MLVGARPIATWLSVKRTLEKYWAKPSMYELGERMHGCGEPRVR